MRVSVIGGGRITDEQDTRAEAVGRELGERGHTVVCGGLRGTMEAVCRGAKTVGGETIGILPTADRDDANPFVDIAIATGMGHARNAMVPLNGDGVLALAGGPGTLSEIGFALVYDRPVIRLESQTIAGLEGDDVPGVECVETPAEAVETLEAAVSR